MICSKCKKPNSNLPEDLKMNFVCAQCVEIKDEVIYCACNAELTEDEKTMYGEFCKDCI